MSYTPSPNLHTLATQCWWNYGGIMEDTKSKSGFNVKIIPASTHCGA